MKPLYRILNKTVTLGSPKPLQFSTNIAGGVKRLTGVGVFIPATENQFASADITPSSSQSTQVNPVGGKQMIIRVLAPLGGTNVYLCTSAGQEKKLTGNGNSKYTISGLEIAESSGSIFYLKAVTSGTLVGGQEVTRYYSAADTDLSFNGTKKADLVQSNDEPADKFGLLLKRSDTLTVVLTNDGATVEISRSLPIFSEFNGISVKMMINNRQDNPLAMTIQTKITMPFKPVATTTEEAQREMRKALFLCPDEEYDTEDYLDGLSENESEWQYRLVPMNYDVRNHNKIDFIVDVNEGNTINDDYIGEQCDLKVYLRYE